MVAKIGLRLNPCAFRFEDGTVTSVANYVRVQYGYKHSFIGYAVLVLCGFIMLFLFITAFALKRFNFQQR